MDNKKVDADGNVLPPVSPVIRITLLSAIMCQSPVAADNMLYRSQLLAGGPHAKFQHKLLCIWTTATSKRMVPNSLTRLPSVSFPSRVSSSPASAPSKSARSKRQTNSQPVLLAVLAQCAIRPPRNARTNSPIMADWRWTILTVAFCTRRTAHGGRL